MILDSLQNASRYQNVHPRFQKVFNYLQQVDINNISFGITELDGKDITLNVVEIDGKCVQDSLLETHKKFIDIHLPLSTKERFGWSAENTLKKPIDTYSEADDITFYTDVASTIVDVNPSEFIIFFPSDGHQPSIAEGLLKKIIVKIKC